MANKGIRKKKRKESLQEQIHREIRQSDRGQARKIRRKRGGLTGVAAGFADYFNIDPLWIRLGLVGGTILTSGIMLIPYAILAYVLPREDQEALTEEFQLEYGDDWPMFNDDLPEAAETQRVCWKCDTVVKPHAKYCHSCGAKI